MHVNSFPDHLRKSSLTCTIKAKANKITFFLFLYSDIRHPEELSLLRKPRDPKKKKKKLEEVEEADLELEGPLLTPGSGEFNPIHSIFR